MVGTPYSPVHLYLLTAFNESLALKPSEGNTIPAPL